MTSVPIKNSNQTECGLSGWMVNWDDTVVLWNGIRVYKRFYEKRNPQDFIPAFIDEQAPKEGTLSENNSNQVTLGGFVASDGTCFVDGSGNGLVAT